MTEGDQAAGVVDGPATDDAVRRDCAVGIEVRVDCVDVATALMCGHGTKGIGDRVNGRRRAGRGCYRVRVPLMFEEDLLGDGAKRLAGRLVEGLDTVRVGEAGAGGEAIHLESAQATAHAGGPGVTASAVDSQEPSGGLDLLTDASKRLEAVPSDTDHLGPWPVGDDRVVVVLLFPAQDDGYLLVPVVGEYRVRRIGRGSGGSSSPSVVRSSG